jgi:hypothetical protein
VVRLCWNRAFVTATGSIARPIFGRRTRETHLFTRGIALRSSARYEWARRPHLSHAARRALNDEPVHSHSFNSRHSSSGGGARR